MSKRVNLKERSIDLKSSAIIINPSADIDKAIHNRDWFIGFANAVSYFEYYGTLKIKEYLDSNVISTVNDTEKRNKLKKWLKDHLGENFERLTAQNIAFWLYICHLIDIDTFLDITDLIVERNKLVHPARARKGIAWRYTKPEETARPLLERAKESIRKVQQAKIKI